MLIEPDVTQLVQQRPAGHGVHQGGAHIHLSLHRETQMPGTTGRIRVELDLDAGRLQSADLEPLDAPTSQLELFGCGRPDDQDARSDRDRFVHSRMEDPSDQDSEDRQRQGSVGGDDAHVRTVEPGSCAAGVRRM